MIVIVAVAPALRDAGLRGLRLVPRYGAMRADILPLAAAAMPFSRKLEDTLASAGILVL